MCGMGVVCFGGCFWCPLSSISLVLSSFVLAEGLILDRQENQSAGGLGIIRGNKVEESDKRE